MFKSALPQKSGVEGWISPAEKAFNAEYLWPRENRKAAAVRAVLEQRAFSLICAEVSVRLQAVHTASRRHSSLCWLCDVEARQENSPFVSGSRSLLRPVSDSLFSPPHNIQYFYHNTSASIQQAYLCWLVFVWVFF